MRRKCLNEPCPNSECARYQKSKDVVKRGRNRARHQQFLCRSCGHWFVETHGTPLYYKNLSQDAVVRICRLLSEGYSIRSIEGATGHHRDTVGRLVRDLALQPEWTTNMLRKKHDWSWNRIASFWEQVLVSKKTLSPEVREALERTVRHALESGLIKDNC